jgi:3-methyl-2-oxobutanoate hydroxymethyltransferase
VEKVAAQKLAGKKMTVPKIVEKAARGEKITMLTAYDFVLASLIDEAGIDIVLVGDSLGTVVAGHETTLPVTLDQMVYHTSLVSRGTKRALVVADMPFMSYQIGREEALRSAGRLVQQGGAQAVKLEGGEAVTEQINALSGVGIPVMAHVGLTPQSVHAMGGFRVQGKSDSGQEFVERSALAVADAGAFCVVLEGVPGELAQRITDKLQIPTIGIGAGAGCDGQVLVVNDLIGLHAAGKERTPKFVRHYDQLSARVSEAVRSFIADVKSGSFPSDEESY